MLLGTTRCAIHTCELIAQFERVMVHIQKGCEWDIFSGMFEPGAAWLPRQILIETHGGHPKAHPFFLYLFTLGYVTAHLEPNIQFGGGDNVEYVFVLLDKEFCPAMGGRAKRALRELQEHDSATELEEASSVTSGERTSGNSLEM